MPACCRCTCKFLGVSRKSQAAWKQGHFQLPFVPKVLVSSPAFQRCCVEAVKVLAMQIDLFFYCLYFFTLLFLGEHPE